MSETDVYPPVTWGGKEANYAEFERVYGFDIRTMSSGDTLVLTTDKRDTRDPQQLGEELIRRPRGENEMTICEYADAIEEGIPEGERFPARYTITQKGLEEWDRSNGRTDVR